MCVFVHCLDAINPILSFFCPFPFLTQEQDSVTGVSEAAKPDQPRLAPHRRTRGSLFKTRACLCNRLHLMICLVPHIAGVLLGTTRLRTASVHSLTNYFAYSSVVSS